MDNPSKSSSDIINRSLKVPFNETEILSKLLLSVLALSGNEQLSVEKTAAPKVAESFIAVYYTDYLYPPGVMNFTNNCMLCQ